MHDEAARAPLARRARALMNVKRLDAVLAGGVGADDEFAMGDAFDGRQDGSGIIVLGEVAPGAGFDRMIDQVAADVSGEHDDASVGIGLVERSHGVERIEPGHLKVHEDDVGMTLTGLVGQVAGIANLSEPGESMGLIEPGVESFADHVVVIDTKDTNWLSIPMSDHD